jgi:vacuolar-type H+-ATPase subunit I/STV1
MKIVLMIILMILTYYWHAGDTNDDDEYKMIHMVIMLILLLKNFGMLYLILLCSINITYLSWNPAKKCEPEHYLNQEVCSV